MKTLFTIPGHWNAAVALCMLALAATPPLSAQGLPEPSLVVYGVVRTGNIRWVAGTLTWRFQSATRTVTVSTPLTNVNDQFSYVLQVPCETEIGAFVASSNVIRLISVATTYDRSQVTLVTDATNSASFANAGQSTMSVASRDRGKVERIDLIASIPLTDLDGNGIPDFWERNWFGRVGIDPNDDFDLDGVSNLAEFKAGTNPTDPNSRFEFINIIDEKPAGVRVEWSSVEATLYTLQRATTLSVDPAQTQWTTIQTHLAATAPRNSFLDTTATGPAHYFYRLQVEP